MTPRTRTCPESGQQGASLPLPLAERSNALCRYCAPAHAGPLVEAEQAVEYVRQARERLGAIAAVSLTGPGEPMAKPGRTLQTLAELRREFPDLALRMSSNGLGVAEHAGRLAAHGLGLVTLRAHAATPETAAGMHAWIRPGVRTMPLDQAASVLVEEQVKAVRALRAEGVAVKLHTLLAPGVNDHEMAELARIMAEAGASAMHVHAFKPFEGAPEDGRAPSAEELAKAREAAGEYLEQIETCGSCDGSADRFAAGWRGAGAGVEGAWTAGPTAKRPYVAVATNDGAEVNEHLGFAAKLLVYGAEGGMGRLVGVRQAPEPGGGEARWKKLAEALPDCFALLAADAGEAPRRVLATHGIQVRKSAGYIEDAVAQALGLQRKKK